ncbi:suppressor APC domain-containing protein 2 isoform X1 [Puntigrus tetrazona]|uniref:suppressor APC domain-containing protein 2 isoform X1 n=1 Tax=Puntigrus tetrazona TaxID=1606681 RepID=UPI001C89DF6B|nr:suppressor APC domain-containing protein 2 isoform X1 [Puntigrus tetrazona]
MALIQADTNGKGNGLVNTLQSGVRKVCPSSKTANMQPKDTEFSTQGLPKAFLHSLRTLFDILDDGRRGYVHISEIESRWRGAEARDLPAGVLESLRRVAPRHGCLTFERFVAGLRNATFNPENGSRSLALNYQQQLKPQQRATRPLGPSNGTNRQNGRNGPQDSSIYSALYPGLSVASRGCGRLERKDCSYQSDAIHVGQNAHRVQTIESLALESPDDQNTAESSGLPRSKSETMTGFTRSRRHTRSRDEQRRHTITNGVDYGMPARAPGPRRCRVGRLHHRLHSSEQQPVLQQSPALLPLAKADEGAGAGEGLSVGWPGRVGESQRMEFLAESCQSQLDVVLPKLQDVTCCLNNLLSFSGKMFPSSSSTSSPPAPPPPPPPQAIHILKEQNRLLTQEVTEKSERITQLEQEKSALIKQLFEARARSTHDSSALDSTFI